MKREEAFRMAPSYLYLLLALFSSPLLPFDARSFKTEKRKPKKNSLHGISGEGIQERKGKPYRVNQHWVPFSKISPYLVKAVFIAEDDKFWKHEGFDYEAIQKAIEKDIQAKKYKFGGSTITQQLAKNLYLSPEKSLIRKDLRSPHHLENGKGSFKKTHLRTLPQCGGVGGRDIWCGSCLTTLFWKTFLPINSRGGSQACLCPPESKKI